ncbi:beta-glucosidase [Flavobacterium fontis]|uniref:beta-N-acetylhexosaminidase n=1 Tax=Flavobacterium fontis TaxID=1124188 RepID=A0A1M4ZEE1_9FLAO|nr:glycoside hydrolase family 3 N-terminal domain-containing protein [Flavobacterium fontis]SHF16177.1 beta-glucosidase [Flavobacterium fontis]
MQHYAKFLFLLFAVAFAVQCNSVKNSPTKTHTSSLPKPNAHHEEDDDVYISVAKADRKTFFKDTPAELRWADSVYNQMTLKERIGQLFMVAAYSNKDSAHVNSLDRLIKNESIGGLIFFQGGPVRQAKLTNRFQKQSKIPLFIGIDAEWGLNMRLDSTYKYPWNMTLGAVKDYALLEEVGRQMALEAKRIGCHFNFVPVLDINTNPKNPIIGHRSFGEEKHNVTDHAVAVMKGVQSTGVFCTGKHFPGHGDTATDSHHALPQLLFDKERIERVELYPYKKMFDEGLVSVMVAHLNIPSLEHRDGWPTSVSHSVVTNLLQEDLGFEGLIFTDALNMKGASKFMAPGQLDLEAFLAGNDILLFPENVPLASENIATAYQNGLVSEDRLAHSVKKILRFKYKIGLQKPQIVEEKGISEAMFTPFKEALHYQIYENAITLVKNQDDILPIKDLRQKIAYVKLGDDQNSPFLQTLRKYTDVTEVVESHPDSLNVRLKAYDLVIVGFHKSDRAWRKHDFSETELQLLDKIAQSNKVILDGFVKPYALSAVPSYENIEAVVVSYQNSEIAQVVSAQVLFGAVEPKGKLPVTINAEFHEGHGFNFTPLNRLGFTAPENVGMSPKTLARIDQVAQKAIDGAMTPGMQVLVARRGKVIFHKAYGNQTYEAQTKIQASDLYDVASVTKIAATLPLVMQLYDQGKLRLDQTLGELLPETKGTNKEFITLKELLSHYARLQAWIPFYKATLDAEKCPLPQYYSLGQKPGFEIQVSENLYLKNEYKESMFTQILDSKLIDQKEYKYSDFTFIILQRIVEKLMGKPLDEAIQSQFYQSMGLSNSRFNPLHKFDASSIAPTEIDNYFRHTWIQGYVHDMAAAMMGGVAGHAGLFSNSLDMAKMMQLYLQRGNYGGIQYFSPETFTTFNTCHYCAEGNRRGLGFDKPQLGKEGPTCGCVSMQSFGHTGFTGTMVWADPESEIVYVFLSNRTFPDSNAPNKLSKENIREEIQKIIQEAILDR